MENKVEKNGGAAPKVSVIVPVYKAEKYLRKCVDSLLAQTFRDFEVILVDDGSPDRSGEICDEYARKYGRKDACIRVFHKANGGVSSARNMGLDNVHGEWVAFVDADDWVGESFLDVFLNPGELTDCDIIHFGLCAEDANGKMHQRYAFPRNYLMSVVSLFQRGIYNPFVCTHFYRYSLIRDIRFNKEIAYSEDREFFFIAALSTRRKVFILRNTAYCYAYHPTSATKTARSVSNCFDDLVALHSIYEYVKRHDLSPYPEAWKFIFHLLMTSFFYVYSCLTRMEKYQISDVARKKVMSATHEYGISTMETVLFRIWPEVVVWEYRMHDFVRRLYHSLRN